MFTLDSSERFENEKWQMDHGCTITNEGAIGGKTTYCFTPTGLGTVVVVKCACGAEKDLTDYSLW